MTLLTEWTLLPNLAFYAIEVGFHKIYATSVACQQKTLIPRDTCSCPTLSLACVLILGPNYPKLVLYPHVLVASINRYFYLLSMKLDTQNMQENSLAHKMVESRKDGFSMNSLQYDEVLCSNPASLIYKPLLFLL